MHKIIKNITKTLSENDSLMQSSEMEKVRIDAEHEEIKILSSG